MGMYASNGIFSIPDSSIMISVGGDHNGSHDSSNVEGGPLEHEMVEKSLLIKVEVSSFFHFLFNWDSSWVVKRVGLISIVVGLNQKPIFITQLVIGVN